ncbi:hypothetical protein HNO84_02030 [Herbaspirillum robiniae]|uniref:Uncharacterized protein n=2 Tax=Herbaspirillum robiniae TaxID=2014887 RepID=A0A246WVL5_9BURK|nr:hypothetical protein [Herbaspirillum robiniae]NUU00359.1 hypothetical protein [Herbaspirillum robiniae]OWY31083.1 hypothetical protein CEJ42_03210 [Herbaspirillum robiniae]
MGFSWMSAIKLIPWGDVVQATPGIVKGARDLWSRTRKTKSEVQAQDLAPATGDTAQLAQRIRQLEEEQLEASQLINTLAEQNAQLVAAMDKLRTRVRALTAFGVLLALGLVAAWLR